MATRDDIIARIDRLPAIEQARVLAFVESLSNSPPKGMSGSELLQFAGTIDPVSAQEMIAAIEEGCERVDVSNW